MTQTNHDTGSGGRYRRTPSLAFSRAVYSRYQPSRRDFADEFYEHLRKWRYETLYESSSASIVQHESFRAIVEMGSLAVPLIISELATKPDHLVAALSLITKASPVPDSARGDFEQMADFWIQWYERER